MSDLLDDLIEFDIIGGFDDDDSEKEEEVKDRKGHEPEVQKQ